MAKRDLNKICVVLVLSAFLLAQAGDAYAWGWHRGHSRRQHPRGKRVVIKQHYLSPIVRGITTLYGWALLNQRCTPHVVVKTAPATMVVVTPAVIEVKAEETVIHIPNSNGSYTAVTLQKSGDGYIGPQGEYYPEHPTVAQLKVLYGK